MLRSFRFVMLIVLLTAIPSIIPSISLAGDTITLTNGEWEPYLGEKLKMGGPASQIVSEAFKQVGIDVKYKWYGDSWKRAYKDALDGKKAQGSLVWSYKPERTKEMYYSKSIVIPGKKDVLWHLKRKPLTWNSVEDLKGMRIGGVLGYTYGEEFDKAEKQGLFNMDRMNDEAKNFRKLLKGRIDLFVTGVKVGEEILKKYYTPEEAALITYNKKPVRIVGYHLLLTKKLPENKMRIKKFDEGFKKVQESGLYDKILADMEAGKYSN